MGAMGAVSGLLFGTSYTVGMRIGYEFYAPKILEDLKAGKSLQDATIEIRAMQQTFSKDMLTVMVTEMANIPAELLKSLGEAFLESGVQGSLNTILDEIAHALGTHTHEEGVVIPPPSEQLVPPGETSPAPPPTTTVETYDGINPLTPRAGALTSKVVGYTLGWGSVLGDAHSLKMEIVKQFPSTKDPKMFARVTSITSLTTFKVGTIFYIKATVFYDYFP